MVYATRAFSDNHIEENADIQAFDTEEAARTFLLGAFPDDEWDHSTAKIEAGSFSDTWIKVYGEIEDCDIKPFAIEQLNIRARGNHPGLADYWIEPRPTILVVSEIDEKE